MAGASRSAWVTDAIRRSTVLSECGRPILSGRRQRGLLRLLLAGDTRKRVLRVYLFDEQVLHTYVRRQLCQMDVRRIDVSGVFQACGPNGPWDG